MDKPQSQRIVERLLALGCTQQEIADACQVSQATISRIASGEISDPRGSTLDLLRAFETLKIAAVKALL